MVIAKHAEVRTSIAVLSEYSESKGLSFTPSAFGEGLLVTFRRFTIMYPSNPFRSNIYRIVWKCSFQKTYRNSKSFRSNTCKKTRGWESPEGPLLDCGACLP